MKPRQPAKYPYYVHERISKEFVALLNTHELFQKEPKAIMAAFKWMNNVVRGQERNEGKPVTFFSVDIQNQFAPYSWTSYTVFLENLQFLKLITIDEFFQPGFQTRYLSQEGICRKYGLTPQGKELVSSSNREYFKKVLVERSLKQKISQQASMNKKRHQPYDDPFLETQRDLLMNLDFVHSTLSESFDHDSECNDDLNHFLDIRAKHFSRLKRNEADNRVWNPVVAMSKRYRQFLKYKKYSYVAEIDQRVCHPTFLGLVLKAYYNTSTIHYVTDNVKSEADRWFAFTTAEEDFRFKLAEEFGWTKERVKESLNIWINGGRVERLEGWFAAHFPALNEVLISLPDRKRTGCMISSQYETRIFQDPDLYQLAESLGLKLSYQYDGVGVFSPKKDIGPELKKLVDHITETAKRLFGVNIRVKVDTIV